jgi:cytochrome c-type biogenesis protein CcmH/NrfG
VRAQSWSPYAAREPSNARALYLLSRVQAAFGDVDKAPAVAERATTLDPRNADYRFQWRRSTGD